MYVKTFLLLFFVEKTKQESLDKQVWLHCSRNRGLSVDRKRESLVETEWLPSAPGNTNRKTRAIVRRNLIALPQGVSMAGWQFLSFYKRRPGTCKEEKVEGNRWRERERGGGKGEDDISRGEAAAGNISWDMCRPVTGGRQDGGQVLQETLPLPLTFCYSLLSVLSLHV